MKKLILSSFLFLALSAGPVAAQTSAPTSADGDTYVTVSTNMGDFTLLLYNDTPLHRDNFIRLCSDSTYNGVLFHRVIKDFLIQGGDPTSRAKTPGVM